MDLATMERIFMILSTMLFCMLCNGETAETKKRVRNGEEGTLLWKFKDHFQRQTKTSDDVSLPFTRETNLYSRAAKKYLQIVGRKVTATTNRRSPYSRFLVESDNFGRVRFKGVQSGRYLCMTKTGKLIAKADRLFRSGKKVRRNRKGRNKKRFAKYKPMRRCVFRETIGRNAYTSYRLVANESWYLSLDKNGKPKRGPQTRVNMKAVHFIERPIGVKRHQYGISERSRARVYRRKNKQTKVKMSIQKTLRSQPIQSDSTNSITMDEYIKRLQGCKKQLKHAIKVLLKLKRKTSSGRDSLGANSRTNSEMQQVLKGIISKLKCSTEISS